MSFAEAAVVRMEAARVPAIQAADVVEGRRAGRYSSCERQGYCCRLKRISHDGLLCVER